MSGSFSNILHTRRFGQLSRDSLYEIMPQKGNLLLTFAIAILSLFLSVNIVNSVGSLEIVLNISAIFRDVFLGLFGIALSFFAIFFSLLGGSQIYRLVLRGDKKLLPYLYYYENVLVLFALAFMLSLFVSLLDSTMVSKISALFCDSYYINTFCCFSFLSFSFRVVCETKSLLFNTFTITRACICLKASDFNSDIKVDEGV